MANPYEAHVQNRTAEEILAALHTADSNLAHYLQTAANIHSNQDLIRALKQASDDSGEVGKKIVWWTCPHF